MQTLHFSVLLLYPAKYRFISKNLANNHTPTIAAIHTHSIYLSRCRITEISRGEQVHFKKEKIQGFWQAFSLAMPTCSVSGCSMRMWSSRLFFLRYFLGQ